MKVYIYGQKRGVTDATRCDPRRRSAIQPVVGHAKSEHRVGRKGAHGHVANTGLAPVSKNF